MTEFEVGRVQSPPSINDFSRKLRVLERINLFTSTFTDCTLVKSNFGKWESH